MSQVLSSKWVKIKKPHLCFSCHRKFESGSRMQKWACIYEGDFCSSYTCETCNEIHSLVPEWWIEDGIPDGFVNESLDKKQTPEEYLQQLKTTKKSI